MSFDDLISPGLMQPADYNNPADNIQSLVSSGLGQQAPTPQPSQGGGYMSPNDVISRLVKKGFSSIEADRMARQSAQKEDLSKYGTDTQPPQEDLSKYGTSVDPTHEAGSDHPNGLVYPWESPGPGQRAATLSELAGAVGEYGKELIGGIGSAVSLPGEVAKAGYEGKQNPIETPEGQERAFNLATMVGPYGDIQVGGRVPPKPPQPQLTGPPGSTPPPRTGPYNAAEENIANQTFQRQQESGQAPPFDSEPSPSGAQAGTEAPPPPAEEPKYAGPQSKREEAIDNILRGYGWDDSDFATMSMQDKVNRAREGDMLQSHGYTKADLAKLDTVEKWDAAFTKTRERGATNSTAEPQEAKDWGLSPGDADILRSVFSKDAIDKMSPEERAVRAYQYGGSAPKKNTSAAPKGEPPNQGAAQSPEVAPESTPASEEGTREAPVDIKTGEDVQKASAIADQSHTPAQGEANNVQRGHAKFNGLDLSIEAPAGGVRRGTAPDGTPFETKHADTYGYIRGIPDGADGQLPDFTMADDPKPDSDAYVIDEIDPKTGKFRQTKSMLGFDSMGAAIHSYLGISSKTADMVGGIKAIPADEFPDFAKSGALSKPISDLTQKTEEAGPELNDVRDFTEPTAEHRAQVDDALESVGYNQHDISPAVHELASELVANGTPVKDAMNLAVLAHDAAVGNLNPEQIRAQYPKNADSILEAAGLDHGEKSTILGTNGAATRGIRPETRGHAAGGKTTKSESVPRQRVQGGGKAQQTTEAEKPRIEFSVLPNAPEPEPNAAGAAASPENGATNRGGTASREPNAAAGEGSAVSGEAAGASGKPEAAIGASGTAVKAPEGLLKMIKRRGGLKPSPDLKHIGIHYPPIKGVGVLVRKGGMTLDKLIEVMQEENYLPPFDPKKPSPDLSNKVYDMLGDAVKGKKILPIGVASEPEHKEQEVVAAQNVEREETLAPHHKALGEFIKDHQLTYDDGQVAKAAGYMADHALDPEAALEKVMADEEMEFDHPHGITDDEIAKYGLDPPYGYVSPLASASAGREASAAKVPASTHPSEAETQHAGGTAHGVGSRPRPEPKLESAPEGLAGQHVIHGAERISSAELAKRRAAERLKPTVAQKQADEGLFGDEKNQTDLLDLARKPAPPATQGAREEYDKAAAELAGLKEEIHKIRRPGGAAGTKVDPSTPFVRKILEKKRARANELIMRMHELEPLLPTTTKTATPAATSTGGEINFASPEKQAEIPDIPDFLRRKQPPKPSPEVASMAKISDRPYKNVPDSLMGFGRYGGQPFDQSKYPHTQNVMVDFGDMPIFYDAVKGMNKEHALERARRNWEGAEIEPVDEIPEGANISKPEQAELDRALKSAKKFEPISRQTLQDTLPPRLNKKPEVVDKRKSLEQALKQLGEHLVGKQYTEKMEFPDKIADQGNTGGAWGDDPRLLKTVGGTYKIGPQIVSLAMADQNYPDLFGSAVHEFYHVAEDTFFNDQDRAILKSEEPRLRRYVELANKWPSDLAKKVEFTEIKAEAARLYTLERINGGAGAGIHVGVRRVFERTNDFVYKVKNLLQGAGYKSASDVFSEFYEGKAKNRPSQRNGSNPEFSPLRGEILGARTKRTLNRALGVGDIASNTFAPSGDPNASGVAAIRGLEPAAKFARSFRNFWTSTFQPELVSDKAFQADPLFARYNALSAHEKDALVKKLDNDWHYWNKKSLPDSLNFMSAIEGGNAQFANAFEQNMAQNYRRMLDNNWAEEQMWGSMAAYFQDYFPHIWKKPEDARAWSTAATDQLGPTWFQKRRYHDTIQDGLAAGLELRYTNPIDLIVHRLMSGVDMRQRMQLLYKLKDDMGMAWNRYDQGGDQLVARGWRPIDAPDRKRWVIHPDIADLWENAVNAKGLWANEKALGSIFRGWMSIKNAWVPIKLALSAFHPLHVLHISMANDFARSWVELTKNKDLNRALKAAGTGLVTLPTLGINKYRQGAQARQAWSTLPRDQTPYQKAQVALMADGGFVPQLSEQMKIGAQRALAEAWQKSQYAKVGYQGLRRAIERVQGPIFEKWIPALKATSYMEEAATLLRRNPSLLQNHTQRRIALRTIAKNVDNRFGEMFYKNIFWNRTIKDAGIGSFLSLGWNLGFVRGFVGAPIETAQKLLAKTGATNPTPSKRTSFDASNKTANMIAYVMSAMMINGAMTAAFTGKMPTGMDYIFARVGGNNPDGSPRRLTNMFYTREVPMLMKHIEERGGGLRGAISGSGEMVWNKLMFEPFKELWDNKTYYGYNIWDENAPTYKVAMQLGKYWFEQQMDPMALSGATQALRTGGTMAKDVPLSLLGFGPAPSYVEKSAIQNRIAYLWREHVAPESRTEEEGETSADKAAARSAILIAKQNKDGEALRAAYKQGQSAGLSVKYMGAVGNTPVDVTMFKRLPKADQEAILKQATDQEFNRYFMSAEKQVRAEKDMQERQRSIHQ